jgi:hypothetical protein
MGMLGCAKAYVLLQPVVMGSAFEPYLSPDLVPDSMWHVREFFPCRFFSSVRCWHSFPATTRRNRREKRSDLEEGAPTRRCPSR